MKTLFIEKPGTELRYERACLLIYHKGERIGSVPLRQLERVVAAPHVVLAAGVLGVLTEYGVALLVLNHRRPERSALLAGTLRGDVHRRLRQYNLYRDEQFRVSQARRLVRLKLSRQYRLLAAMRDARPSLRHPLGKALATLRTLLEDLEDPDESWSLPRLRGVEGAAAASYFKAFCLLFPQALGFANRNRRPPKDPVNACLSLAYTLFYQDAVNALKAVGLDSAVGCYHEPYYQRDSLACDLLEPVRPWIDAWIYRLFNTRELRAEDFRIGTQDCVLLASGKQRFYAAYALEQPRFERLLRLYARSALKQVMQHEPSEEVSDLL
jgi:CRISPR-associated protein Cas1